MVDTVIFKTPSRRFSIRKPTGTLFDRANGFSKKNADVFFDILGSCYEKYNFLTDQIYNVEKTGVQSV